jgi:hypothetical protein
MNMIVRMKGNAHALYHAYTVKGMQGQNPFIILSLSFGILCLTLRQALNERGLRVHSRASFGSQVEVRGKHLIIDALRAHAQLILKSSHRIAAVGRSGPQQRCSAARGLMVKPLSSRSKDEPGYAKSMDIWGITGYGHHHILSRKCWVPWRTEWTGW